MLKEGPEVKFAFFPAAGPVLLLKQTSFGSPWLTGSLFRPPPSGPLIRKLSVLACLVLAGGAFSLLPADEHTVYERFDFRLNWQASRKWYFKNSYQVRFRDELRKYHYFKMELGAGLKLGARFDLPLVLRLEDRHSAAEGHFKNSLLVDPTVLFYSSGRWQVDLRGRCQFQLSDGFGWLYFRPRPRLFYHFSLAGRQSSLFFYNDFFIQLKRENRSQHLHQNMFGGGLTYTLGRRSSLDFYYLVFSSRSDEQPAWEHLHQPALAYNLNY